MPDDDTRLIGAWDDAARKVLNGLVNGRVGTSARHADLMPAVRTRLRRLVGEMRAGGTTGWTPAIHAAWVASNHLDETADAWPDGHDAVVAKAVRLGHSVATDRPEDVPPPERAFLAHALPLSRRDLAHDGFLARLAAQPADPARAPRPGSPVPSGFDFAYAWGVPSRRGGSRRSLVTSRATAALRQVDVASAPPVLRLRMASGDWLVLREHEGALLRPVLAPGSSGPVSVEDFLDAVLSGRAWADDPFASPVRDRLVLLDREAAPWTGTPGDARTDAARALALHEASARAGSLTVVDGIVHRRTGKPTCYLSGSVAPDPGTRRVDVVVHQSWRLGDDLDMWDPQSSVDRSNRGIVRDLTALRFHPNAARAGTPDALSFPIGSAASALALARSAFDGRDVVEPDRFVPGRPGFRAAITASHSPNVEILDPGLYPPDRLAMAEAILMWGDDEKSTWPRSAEATVVLEGVRALVRAGGAADGLLEAAVAVPCGAAMPGSLSRTDLLVALASRLLTDLAAEPDEDPVLDAFRP